MPTDDGGWGATAPIAMVSRDVDAGVDVEVNGDVDWAGTRGRVSGYVQVAVQLNDQVHDHDNEDEQRGRRGAGASLLALVLLMLGAGRAGAQDAGVHFEMQGALHPGAGAVEVVVRLPRGPSMPLLLTVGAEAGSLQVVRARFLRADARLDSEGALRFEVPVVAVAAGSAVLRAELSTYRCARRCEQVRLAARLSVQVMDTPVPAAPP